MEQAFLNVVQGGITAESLILIFQLIIVAFLILWVKGWITKTWSWHKFQKSTMVGIGTPVTVTINGAKIVEGEITGASKSNIVVTNEQETAIIKTSKFVGGNYDWVIRKLEDNEKK